MATPSTRSQTQIVAAVQAAMPNPTYFLTALNPGDVSHACQIIRVNLATKPSTDVPLTRKAFCLQFAGFIRVEDTALQTQLLVQIHTAFSDPSFFKANIDRGGVDLASLPAITAATSFRAHDFIAQGQPQVETFYLTVAHMAQTPITPASLAQFALDHANNPLFQVAADLAHPNTRTHLTQQAANLETALETHQLIATLKAQNPPDRLQFFLTVHCANIKPIVELILNKPLPDGTRRSVPETPLALLTILLDNIETLIAYRMGTAAANTNTNINTNTNHNNHGQRRHHPRQHNGAFHTSNNNTTNSTNTPQVPTPTTSQATAPPTAAPSPNPRRPGPDTPTWCKSCQDFHPFGAHSKNLPHCPPCGAYHPPGLHTNPNVTAAEAKRTAPAGPASGSRPAPNNA
jgi:hypothetical protein